MKKLKNKNMKKTFVLLSFCVISLTLFAQNASDYLEKAKAGDVVAQMALGECYEIRSWCI